MVHVIRPETKASIGLLGQLHWPTREDRGPTWEDFLGLGCIDQRLAGANPIDLLKFLFIHLSMFEIRAAPSFFFLAHVGRCFVSHRRSCTPASAS
jgi:hypothetical protein